MNTTIENAILALATFTVKATNYKSRNFPNLSLASVGKGAIFGMKDLGADEAAIKTWDKEHLPHLKTAALLATLANKPLETFLTELESVRLAYLAKCKAEAEAVEAMKKGAQAPDSPAPALESVTVEAPAQVEAPAAKKGPKVAKAA